MKIQKNFQGNIPDNKLMNVYTESNTDGYSCDYINNMTFSDGDVDELPVGTVIHFDGEEIPEGWSEVVEESDDSGWIYPTLNEGWSNPYSSTPTRYRKIGKIVHIESFADATAAAGNVLFTLPEGFRPSVTFTRYPAYADNTVLYVDINASGTVSILNKTGALTWVSINYTFMID